ncbi:unnamed protein product [Camellia sinensis]
MTEDAEEDESQLKSQLFVLVIIFGSAALVVFFYHLVKITWYNRRHRARSRQPRPRTGPENSTVEAIPAHKYRKGADVAGGEDAATCAVCLCDFEEGDEVRTLPGCMHSFHVDCIDMWLFSHSNCPMCRSDAVSAPHTPAGRHGSNVVPELGV